MAIESPGIMSRISERVISWVVLALIVAAGIGIWQMGPELRQAWLTGLWRTLLWLVIAASVPWLGWVAMPRLLELGSNWVGVALLAVWLLLDVVAGVLLLTAWPASWGAWLAVLALLGVALAYNYLVSEYLAQRIQG
jgi:hypothetical protein